MATNNALNAPLPLTVSNGGTGDATFTAYAVITGGTTSTGALQSVSGVGTSGQVLTSGGASTLPTWTTLSGAIVWSVITADQTAAVNHGYICNKASLLTLTLPTTSAIGDIIEVAGMNIDLGWKIAQNANQVIHFGTSDTTTGTGGSLASTKKYDSIRIVCNIANLEWIVMPGTQGNITVV